MKKAFKILMGTLCALVALVIVAVLALPLWFGPVVKTVANQVVPKVVKTGFHLGNIGLNPYSGVFAMGDMQLENPAGYATQHAVTLGNLLVDVDMGTVMSQVIHVERITVADVFVSYVSANGKSNVDQLKENVTGGKAKPEAPKAEPAEPAKPAAEKKEGRKFVIDRLELTGIKVQIGVMPLPLPSIVLTDIGKKTNGATLAEIGDQISAAVMKTLNQLGDGAKLLGNLLGDGASATMNTLGDGAKKLRLDAATDATVKGAGKMVDGASDVLKGAGNAVKDVGGTLKGLFGK